MSNRNNDVHKVLVTSGDQDILATGNDLDALAVGQIGFFDAKTNLSIDETDTPVEKLYIGVGLDRDADTVKDDVDVSAGQFIQTRNLKQLSYRPHTAPRDMELVIGGYTIAECDSDYTVKFELRDQEIYRIQGHNQFTKAFSVRTPCCIGTQTTIDGNELTLLLRDAINKDETFNRALSATATARQPITIATHGVSQDYAVGDVVLDADIAVVIAFNAANPGSEVYTDITVTVGALPLQTFCNVNLKYFHPRRIFVIPSLDESMVCIDATVTTTVTLAFEEGNGYDIQQKEYHSQLDGSGPYVLLTIPGTAKNRTFFADQADQYDQFIFEYDQESASGWGNYDNVLATIVAIPAADTTTRDAFVAAIDVLFAGLGLDELASDVAAADTDPAVVEPTADKDDYNDDGLA